MMEVDVDPTAEALALPILGIEHTPITFAQISEFSFDLMEVR